MRNAGLDEAQAGIEIAGRNINNLRYADDTTLMAESEEEVVCLLIFLPAILIPIVLHPAWHFAGCTLHIS